MILDWLKHPCWLVHYFCIVAVNQSLLYIILNYKHIWLYQLIQQSFFNWLSRWWTNVVKIRPIILWCVSRWRAGFGPRLLQSANIGHTITIKPFVNWQPVYLLWGKKDGWSSILRLSKKVVVVCLFLKLLLSNWLQSGGENVPQYCCLFLTVSVVQKS